MAKYRLSFIFTTIWLIFIFNIERLDNTFLGSEPFNLHSAFYVFALMVTVALAFLPSAGEMRTLTASVLVAAAYAIVRFFVWQDSGSSELHIIALEFALLTFTVVMMRRMSQSLYDFEYAAETFVLGTQNTTLLSQDEGKAQIDQELYLARRFDRPLTMLYCEADPTIFADDEKKVATIDAHNVQLRVTDAFKRRFAKYQLLQTANALTYKGDTTVDYQDGFLVCLPETSIEEAQVWATRLNELAKDRFGWQVKVGKSAFPSDGLVFEDIARNCYQRRAVVEAPAAEENMDVTEPTPTHSGSVWIAPTTRMEIEAQDTWFSRFRNQTHSSRELYMKLKRGIDVALVMLALPLVAPIGVLVGLLIYLEDGESPFYIQERTGYRGRRFSMYKFRSMRVNAQVIPAQQVVLADGSVRHIWPEKMDKDPRVTRVGSILRKTSLDELPQLLNVLNGDMSLVGPRPSSWGLDKYTLHQTERLTVRPGITGLWQVCARDSQNMDERLLWDMKYIDKISPMLDVQIILRTVMAVFLKKGV